MSFFTYILHPLSPTTEVNYFKNKRNLAKDGFGKTKALLEIWIREIAAGVNTRQTKIYLRFLH
jgi:hypothetical protein